MESHTTPLTVSLLAGVGAAEAGPAGALPLSLFCPLASKRVREDMECAIALAAQWTGPALTRSCLSAPATCRGREQAELELPRQTVEAWR